MLQDEDFTCTGSRVTDTFISCTLGLNAIVYLLGKIVICLPFCFNKYADTALSTPPETPHTILRNDIVLTAPHFYFHFEEELFYVSVFAGSLSPVYNRVIVATWRICQ